MGLSKHFLQKKKKENCLLELQTPHTWARWKRGREGERSSYYISYCFAAIKQWVTCFLRLLNSINIHTTAHKETETCSAPDTLSTLDSTAHLTVVDVYMLIWFKSFCFKSGHVQVDSASAKKGPNPACWRDREKIKASNCGKRCCIKDRLQLFSLVPPWNYSLKFYCLLSPPTIKWDFRPCHIGSSFYLRLLTFVHG